jgi:phospholipid-binding lipoprotein MlaA
MMKKPALLYQMALVLLMGAALCPSAFAADADLDPRDPWERYNRDMYRFNEAVDRSLFQPLARGYNAITPDLVNRGITNFFNNLEDVRSALNNLLQFKFGRALSDVGRVAVNSTAGLLGFMDVASNVNLPRYNEDFGQTLGSWGVASGPYVVLPFFGPSSVRDGVGVAVDWFTDPVILIDNEWLRWGMRALDIVDTRADLLYASRVLEQAALDPYSFIRDAYLQRRQDLVYDGNPPAE